MSDINRMNMPWKYHFRELIDFVAYYDIIFYVSTLTVSKNIGIAFEEMGYGWIDKAYSVSEIDLNDQTEQKGISLLKIHQNDSIRFSCFALELCAIQSDDCC